MCVCTFCICILTDKICTLSTLPAVLWHNLFIVGYLHPQNMNWRAVQDLEYSETKICLASWLSWGLQFGVLLKATLCVAIYNFFCIDFCYPLEKYLVKWILFQKSGNFQRIKFLNNSGMQGRVLLFPQLYLYRMVTYPIKNRLCFSL